MPPSPSLCGVVPPPTTPEAMDLDVEELLRVLGAGHNCTDTILHIPARNFLGGGNFATFARRHREIRYQRRGPSRREGGRRNSELRNRWCYCKHKPRSCRLA